MDVSAALAGVRAVFFDVGETLVDESVDFGGWADWLGVPRHTFSAVLGQVIARGQDHREVFQVFRPGFDLAVERRRRAQGGYVDQFEESDLYPDARRCLSALRRAGYFVGVAGNQPASAGQRLRELGIDADVIATSAQWAVEKPAPEFFQAIVDAAGVPADRVAYVGDRLDNDVLPASRAGMVAVFLRRGPWGYWHATLPEVSRAHLRIDSLDELAAHLTGPRGRRPD